MKESITSLAGYVTAPQRHRFTGESTPVTVLTMMMTKMSVMTLIMMTIMNMMSTDMIVGR